MNEPIVPGQILLGKYRVEYVLGKGGMGIVAAVRHVDLGQMYAMKFLSPDMMGVAEFHERFLREAKAAALLTSEHVARVQDVGRTESGVPFIVMEYLEGCDLKALVSKEGPLSVEDTVAYVLQVCDAIMEAHKLGIVHRDLKPANLFVVRRRNGSSCIKVLDFGISKQMEPQGIELTQTNAALGSPLYMSPEQMAKSKTVDGRTDIWALGVVLYELLAGASPFRGASIFEVTSRVLQEEPTPLRELRGDIPQALEMIIQKCLKKRREERFSSVDDLHEALTKFRAPGVIEMPSSPATVVDSTIVMTRATGIEESTTITFGQTGRSNVSHKPRTISWVGLSVVSIMAVGMGFRWLLYEPTASPAASSTAVPLDSIAIDSQHRAEPLNTAQLDGAPSATLMATVAPIPEKPKRVAPQIATGPNPKSSTPSTPMSPPAEAPSSSIKTRLHSSPF